MIKFNKRTLQYEVIFGGRVIASVENKNDARRILAIKRG